MMRLVVNKDKQILPYQEAIEIINLGNNEERKEVKICIFLSMVAKEKIISLLYEFTNVFA